MSDVRYAVTLADPRAHLFRVRCSVAQPDPAGQHFAMPAWVRGSYRIRDLARHVVRVTASAAGAPVPLDRCDKSTIRCAPCAGPLALEYDVYARDPSVRKAWLDERRAFFDGAALFYRAVGLEAEASELHIQRPSGEWAADWSLATSMTPVTIDDSGFGTYRAADYAELIDHPVAIGSQHRIAFEVDGIPHALVLSGRCETDGARLARDLAAICRTQRALFSGEPRLDRYHFLCNVRAHGYGGLEHRASASLVTDRDALPRVGDSNLRRGYRGFLGLLSHEYFHLWNVKRITPQRFAESDLSAEAYTRDLWAYEGVTSYYDDLLLLRAGLVDAPAWLDLVAETATRMQRAPGHAVQTLADASFEAWIKLYQPDENTSNACVSYYTKGALVALCLDLSLRRDSTTTLDAVMRRLWTRYGARGEPAPEGALEAVAAELCGRDLTAIFDKAVRSTEPLPLAGLLAQFAVEATLRPRHGDTDAGGRCDGAAPAVDIGLRLNDRGVIASVRSDSPAQAAGLAEGDVPIALDGLQANTGSWAKRLEALTPGRRYRLHFFRDEELLETGLEARPPSPDTWTFTLAERAPTDALARRKAWIGV